MDKTPTKFRKAKVWPVTDEECVTIKIYRKAMNIFILIISLAAFLSCSEQEQRSPGNNSEQAISPFIGDTVTSIGKNIDCIILSGGCAAIPGIEKLVSQSLGVNTYIANPFIDMTLSHKVKPQTLSSDAPSMMLACGLALRSFD